MAIKYWLDAQGGFTCGDDVSRVTAYAYPTSTYAVQAKRHPERVAKDMLAVERASCSRRPESLFVKDYDVRNWSRLNAA